jgi:mycothiol synthase
MQRSSVATGVVAGDPVRAGVTAASELAPPGVTFRARRDEADFDTAVELFEASRPVDAIPYTKSAAAMAADFATLGEKAGMILAENDGQPVGYVRLFDFGMSSDAGRLLTHGGQVRPAWRGRGVGRALLAGAQAHLLALEAHDPAPEAAAIGFETGVVPTAVDTVALVERGGYAAARYFIEMVRPTLDDPPFGALPDGIEVRPALPEHRLAVAHALNEAFRDHRAWPSFTDEQMLRGLEHPLRGQLDIWQVAWSGDQVVGGVLGFIDEAENVTFARRRGYTEQIFTRRPWRGRGIASALIGRNLRTLRERGMTEAALAVDTENPSGALRLYERLGFAEEGRMVTYRREVRAAAH